MSEFSNKLQAETLKFILLDQLIKINVQEFKDDTHVIAEYEIIEPVNKQTNARDERS